jgi:PhzF family phenazine biosynthesis protein
MLRPFLQVDVFGDAPYLGNPLAVVLDGAGLGTTEMQAVARWANLSETVFLMAPTRPDADYLARIFSPAEELPFAGHPTLGACHAWLSHTGQEGRARVVQQCQAGLVRLRRREGRLELAAPRLLRFEPAGPDVVEHVASCLRLSPAEIVAAYWVDNGPGWVGVLLEDADAVLGLTPGPLDMKIGVAGPYPPGSACAFEVRAFFPLNGAATEDPVTGSFNAGLAQWFFSTGIASGPYVASQGTVLGRRGRAHVCEDEGEVWVGGRTTTCISGFIEA